MVKETKKTAAGTIIVTVARFGDDPINVTIPVGGKVSDALTASGLTVTGREKSYVEGVEAENSDVLENGDILSIVTPKQAGNN